MVRLLGVQAQPVGGILPFGMSFLFVQLQIYHRQVPESTGKLRQDEND